MKRKCTTSILEPVNYCNVLNCSKTKLFKSIWLKLRSNYFRLYANLHVQFVYSIRQTALYPKMYTSVPTVGNWKCAKLKVKLTKESKMCIMPRNWVKLLSVFAIIARVLYMQVTRQEFNTFILIFYKSTSRVIKGIYIKFIRVALL